MADHKRYITIEAIISAAFGFVLSFFFTFVAFGEEDRVPVGGFGLIFDSAPQTFSLTFMSALIPTLLTRKRMRAGAIAPMAARPWPVPRSAPLRAFLLALLLTAVAVPLTALLLFAGPSHHPFWPVAFAKATYGMIMAAIVAIIAVRAVLTEAR